MSNTVLFANKAAKSIYKSSLDLDSNSEEDIAVDLKLKKFKALDLS